MLKPAKPWAASLAAGILLTLAACTVVLATEEQLAAFREAAAPVYSTLEQDAGTRDLIARLRELAARAPADPAVEPCDYDTY